MKLNFSCLIGCIFALSCYSAHATTWCAQNTSIGTPKDETRFYADLAKKMYDAGNKCMDKKDKATKFTSVAYNDDRSSRDKCYILNTELAKNIRDTASYCGNLKKSSTNSNKKRECREIASFLKNVSDPSSLTYKEINSKYFNAYAAILRSSDNSYWCTSNEKPQSGAKYEPYAY